MGFEEILWGKDSFRFEEWLAAFPSVWFAGLYTHVPLYTKAAYYFFFKPVGERIVWHRVIQRDCFGQNGRREKRLRTHTLISFLMWFLNCIRRQSLTELKSLVMPEGNTQLRLCQAAFQEIFPLVPWGWTSSHCFLQSLLAAMLLKCSLWINAV